MTDHIKIGNVMPRIQFVGNGIATQFVYPFAIFRKEDLEAYLNDVKQASGFSVSGAGSSFGGTVTFSVAPGVGVVVTLRRSLTIQRTTDFQESGDFRAATLNDELDYQTAALQTLAADLAASVRAAPTDDAANLILPKKAARAGKILGFNHDGGVEARVPPVAGVNHHSQLGGLQNDDHPQYLTGARANAWLDTRTTDSLAEGVTNKYMRLAGTGTNTTAARTDHHHAGVYEPAFPKNTAFNQNFGNASTDVAAGDHTHAFALGTFALSDLGNVTEAGRAEGYALTWSSAAAQWEPRPQTGGGGSAGRFGLRNLITNATFRINQRRNFAATLASALLVIGLASIAGGALATTSHPDDGHGAAVQELRLDQGKRWPTDEPLRQGMSDIRAAMATAFPQIHMGQFSSAQYGALAAKIQERVDHIVGNCRLPEEADAQLHGVLMEIVEGTEAMRSGPDRLRGSMRIIQAIEAYGRNFDHPDWRKSQAL